MTSSGHSSDEDFLESLGISLDINLTVDADTHASVTGIYAQELLTRNFMPPPDPVMI
ncbi:hypothetical protein JCGZ_19983 [Jatropha curcas]|uniref:Uncharacterized protein n=1 Tax=Jatropha curcas TaxID=180498 RepID=A0A067K7G5_JATCU|nr:hypothetical protein JCGZ_19983 [Jatropha curcas]